MAAPSAVITGAASGIGLALSTRLARNGYRVVMSDIRADALHDARATVEAAAPGAAVVDVVADVTDAASVEALAAAAVEEFGGIDLAINNAGVIGPVGPVWEGPLEQWQLALGINFWGVLHGMRAFLPRMIAAGGGRLVNIASVASWSSGPQMGSYGAAKHAVLALTESAYRELAELGSPVRLSVVCPTTVRTSLVSHLEGDASEQGSIGRTRLLAARERGLDPAAVAETVVAGIEADQYLITTDPEWVLNAARQRVAIAEGAEPPLDREPPRRA